MIRKIDEGKCAVDVGAAYCFNGSQGIPWGVDRMGSWLGWGEVGKLVRGLGADNKDSA